MALVKALVHQGLAAQPAIWFSPKQEWKKFDAVVVRSCWDYHLRLGEFLDWIGLLERSGIVILNRPELIRWNANKTYLGELAESGIAIPDTVFVGPSRELDLGPTCKSRGWREAVVKPTVSASAHRTERRRTGRVRGPAMAQEFVAAVEAEGEWSLIYLDGEFSHAVLKKPKTGDFRVQANYGGTRTVGRPPKEFRALGDAALRRLRWSAAFARVDAVAGRDSPLLMELEVIEPELFLDLVPGSDQRLASVIRHHLS